MQKFETAADQLAALRAEFPPESIKVREEGGIKLHYLEWSTVENRLLDVLGPGGFDIRVGRIFTSKNRVDMECALTVRFIGGETQTVDGFGSADILFLKTDKELPYDERRWASDSFKSAHSDALKVAAAKLGVGLHLYDKEAREELEKAVKAAHAEREDKAKAERAQITANAMITCQSCKKQITPGTLDGKVYEDPVVLMRAIRGKCSKKLCLSCYEALNG